MLYQNEILCGNAKKDYYKLHQVVLRYLANQQTERNRREMDSAAVRGNNIKSKSNPKGKGRGSAPAGSWASWSPPGKSATKGKGKRDRTNEGAVQGSLAWPTEALREKADWDGRSYKFCKRWHYGRETPPQLSSVDTIEEWKLS